MSQEPPPLKIIAQGLAELVDPESIIVPIGADAILMAKSSRGAECLLWVEGGRQVWVESGH